MARFALALAAIVILILSAGPTHSQPQAARQRAGAASAAAFQDNTNTFRAELMLMKRTAITPAAQRSPNEEPTGAGAASLSGADSGWQRGVSGAGAPAAA